ncbi:hypothetical protein CPLU01_16126 [Colletotrichum plurivorum]|uniref:Uncharacterized protein n=1 Tax=Colletotrichum plurivorum TaxID=2175906 RepID=A0A8H6MP98_9PEZI|nr:hypothetical protein CPLU01_16126 [Colletotrichum plurivorum]
MNPRIAPSQRSTLSGLQYPSFRVGESARWRAPVCKEERKNVGRVKLQLRYHGHKLGCRPPHFLVTLVSSLRIRQLPFRLGEGHNDIDIDGCEDETSTTSSVAAANDDGTRGGEEVYHRDYSIRKSDTEGFVASIDDPAFMTEATEEMSMIRLESDLPGGASSYEAY